ncbi:carbon starvation protein A [Escherichia coli]|uniref:Carbon starvation protein A n=1 Tax=Escherichia coli TaxID=562 RepID=A0A5N3D177_ECOLX|nr:carbon starvation protein A [Escherichia coli]KAB0124208.1 carbon starvation protein A [Escherichia coli]
MNKSGKYLVWTVLSVMGAFALGYIALNRGEQINALWIVVASVCIYLIAYRFYGLYIAKNVLAVDPTRMTPAVRHNDGLDYVPTDKKVLFGHHFAAIAGAGPLVGPVLAAQMGYLPGMIWLLAGVVLAGAVQDFMVLFVSTRRDGRSLGELVKEEMGPTAGVIALVACFMIMVIILAVLAMIVVKALTHSPWGTYTVAFTIPLALFMGIYLRYLRPGRIGEVSVIGLVFLIFAIISGGWVAESPTWAPYFDFTGVQLTWMLVGYGFVAAVLPVWLLLAPRDYLSTFLKIGTIVGLAVGILIMRPTLTMPALTKFVDGTGPVWTGNLFPFLFITIACGAVSGFHALISSGTTPKMLANEGQACFIGYGGMLMESFVAIMALVSACIIDPGVYFAMNSPMAVLAPAGTADVVASAAQVVSSWGFAITPDTLNQIASEVGEQSIISRAGGAPTLAVGMAYILHGALGGINTLWPLFGIANQMLAGMALMLCAVVLFKMKRQRYAWVALVPTAWLLICTLTAGWQKAFSPDAKVGFLAIANKFQAMIDSGNIPSQYTESQLAQLVFNNRLDAGLTIFFMVVVVVLALFSIKTALAALKEPKPTAKETPYEPMPENVEEIVAQAKGAH